MITTRELAEWLELEVERQERRAGEAVAGNMPITNHAYASSAAAKAELLRSLIKVSQRDDKRREADQ